MKLDNIICGVDAPTQSSWLAYNKMTGDICFLTNYRTPANQQPKEYTSRGHLVLEYVKIFDPTIDKESKAFVNLEDYEKMLFTIVTRGFNIVYGNVFTREFKYYQFKNSENREMLQSIVIEPGHVYGFSNGGFDEWDKVSRGKDLFKEVLKQAEIELKNLITDNLKSKSFSNEPSNEVYKVTVDEFMKQMSKELLAMMKNNIKSAWGLVQQNTGYPKYWEYMNSSIFAGNNLANFCTVSTTVLIVHKSGHATFHEQRYRHNSTFFSRLGGTINFCRPRYEVDTEVIVSFDSEAIVHQKTPL